jgi:NADH dehydrogenase [ubiquinone] 1 alpha subcomplex assembly factor 5
MQRPSAIPIRLLRGPLKHHHPRLTYATLNPHTPPPTTPYEVFDEPSKIRQRDRALLRLKASSSDAEGPKIVDYIREELSERLAERIEV